MDSFGFKQAVLLICLVGIVGSSASLVNSIFNNANAMIAAAVGSGMFVLFISLTAELVVYNIKSAIHDQKVKENDELLAAVIAKSVYTAIKEDQIKNQ
jgi:hypothetical protein